MQRVVDKKYYAVLGVARDADEQTLKKAYRQAILTAHPDKGGTDAEFQEVNEAWTVLSDATKRAGYDRVSSHRIPSNCVYALGPGALQTQ